ncbi:MarR family transcriptional regulator [Clostridium sp. KNHs216]|jgi:DNA-binding MarR family transcriptional regulator|uniref:MarR family winged helix-turn-helix transcriptional regulator n=1 Tax=Clostridium sp. KNHs216 TaxID=1550235 RepID=UPI000689D7F0|nr:MarR family transcriptional regulator [Clostridium sp. KNHs216]MBE6831002.1 MarR family transcriptional regulator [Oscillospiraceae bacterium]TQI66352.1 DNA-binding MarR family transcriptional regulator [Clostridium sp. KNHs216]
MSESKYSGLVEQFMQIQWLLIRHHHHNHMAFGLTGNPYRGQGRVLKLLKMKPEITQKELSDLMDMRPQSLGDLLKKLEQKGYITRTPSEDDKRVMIIRLTEKGKNAEIQDDRQLGFETLFDCLSEEEQTKLGEYLERIIDDWRGDNEQEFGFGHFGHDGFWNRHS